MTQNAEHFGIDLGGLELRVDDEPTLPVATLARPKARTLTDRLASAAEDRESIRLP